MSFFQKNLEALKLHRPSLYSLIVNTPDLPAYLLYKNKAGESDVLLQFAGGEQYSYYGCDSPSAYSKEIIEKIKLTNPRVLFFLGFGLGHHVIEYIKKPHPLNRSIIIVENQVPLFKKAMEVLDLTPLFSSGNVYLLIGCNEQQVKLALNQFFSNGNHLSYANAVEYIVLPPANHYYRSYYEEFQKIIPQAIGYQYNRHFGDPFDAFMGIRNTLANLKKISSMPAIDLAFEAFAGKPGVVIASGPSLNEALPYLQKIQDKALLIAAPSALPVLLKNNIHPHLWLNIERLAEQGKFLNSLPQDKNHFFVGPPLVDASCFENTENNAFVLSANLLSVWLPLEGKIIELGHSSAHAAFLLLKELGCSEIYLVGQDLAYDDKQSHAEGTWVESQKIMQDIQEKNEKDVQVLGNSGQMVKTNLFWYTFLKTFEEQLLPQYSGSVYHVIDSRKGAKINGATRISAQDFDQRLSSKENLAAFSILKEKLKTSLKPQDIENKIRATIQKTITQLALIEKESLEWSLRCKETQFHQDVITGHWDVFQPFYQKFLTDLDNFFNSLTKEESPDKIGWTYNRFLLPLFYGSLLNYRIEFFGSAGDLDGDFKQIKKKMEILHHLFKDQTHWATLARLELQKYPL